MKHAKKRTSPEVPILEDSIEGKIKRCRAALIAALIRYTPKSNSTRKGKRHARRH